MFKVIIASNYSANDDVDEYIEINRDNIYEANKIFNRRIRALINNDGFKLVKKQRNPNIIEHTQISNLSTIICDLIAMSNVVIYECLIHTARPYKTFIFLQKTKERVNINENICSNI